MNQLGSLLRNSRTAAVTLGGLLVAALGLLVILGWLFRNPALLRLNTNYALMQFNTAAGFVICGAGVLALLLQRRVTTSACGVLVAMLGVATLAQYIFAVDLGIDLLIFPDFVDDRALSPGRMAPNTALGFLFGGLALISLSYPAARIKSWRLPEIFGALIAALGLSALCGYLLGIGSVYDWALWTRMAILTAIGFCTLGATLIAAAWHLDNSVGIIALRRLFLPVSICAVAVLFAIWQGLLRTQHTRIVGSVEDRSAFLENVLLGRVGDDLLALDRMADRWERQNGTPREAWEYDAQEYLDDISDFGALAWVDRDTRLRWVVSDDVDRQIEIDSLPFSAAQRARLDAAWTTDSVTIFPSAEVFAGATGFVAIYPLRSNSPSDGFLLCLLDLQDAGQTFYETLHGLSFLLLSGTTEIMRRGDGAWASNRWSRESTVWLAGREWTLRSWPEDRMLAALHSTVPDIVLGSGLILFVLLLLVVSLAISAEARAQILAAVNTKLKETQAQLEHLALYDELTGLGNRSLFKERLDSLAAIAKRHEQRFGLLIMDLNGFKAVNDILGHNAGDAVLREFARRLTAALRESDQAFRLGGDEFAVLLAPNATKEGTLAVAKKINEAIRAPMQLKGEDRILGVSIGSAVFPDHGKSFSELTRKADAAMYEAKTRGESMAIASDLGATTVMKALREA